MSEPQIDRFILYCSKNKYSTLHIDATGSVCRKLTGQKRILLYAAIFKDGDDASNTVPLAHAVLADHTATSIAFYLGSIRQAIVTTNEKLVRPCFFVIDFSAAILNAILQTFNYENVNGHLKRCWNVLLRKHDSQEMRSFSFIRFCCCHVIHAFSRSLKAAKIPKEIRSNTIRVFALMLMMTDLSAAFSMLKTVVNIFGSPNATDSKERLSNLAAMEHESDYYADVLENCEIEEEGVTDVLDEIDEHSHSSTPIVHQSPFTLEASRQIPEMKDLLHPKTKYENVVNPLFSRKVILVFYKWFAYLPMWTNLLYKFDERYQKDIEPIVVNPFDAERLSNAVIESYFAIVKKSILNGKRRLRPFRLIDCLHESVEVQIKAGKFGINQSSKRRNRANKGNDVNVEEPWGKNNANKQRRTKYFPRFKRKLSKDVCSKQTKSNDILLHR